MATGELIPLEKAAKRLGVTRASLWGRVKRWGLTVYDNPLDGRQRLLDWNEVALAVQPRKRSPNGTAARPATEGT